MAADEGHLVNTSSICGFWASAGPARPSTAYSAAKFAIKGFSEALVTDLRLHAPHVSVSVVMPGHIGTAIFANSAAVLGRADDPLVTTMGAHYIESAPVTARQAAAVVLDGVRSKRWRILVGHDAELLDEFVRDTPEEAYEPSFADRLRSEGVLGFFLS